MELDENNDVDETDDEDETDDADETDDVDDNASAYKTSPSASPDTSLNSFTMDVKV